MENENGGFFKFPFSISVKISAFFNFCRNSFYKSAGSRVKQCQFYSLYREERRDVGKVTL